jgi:uncharacterized alkaline shock family protein YloU
MQLNETQKTILLNVIPKIIIAILEKIPQTEELAKTVKNPLQAVLDLLNALSKDTAVTEEEANAAVDEALAVLAQLKAETA